MTEITAPIKEYALKLRRHFHQNPEPAMQEYETSKKIKQELESLGIPYVSAAETGVIAIIGQGEKTIALRADMDALFIEEETDAEYASANRGLMHACGHDCHMAALLGTAKALKAGEGQLKVKVKLIFQPAEEKITGARLIIREGYLADVDQIFGQHIFGDIPVGQMSIEPGPVMAGAGMFQIRISGKPGHAGKPHQCVDGALVTAAIMMNLQSIISRNTNPLHAAVISIGKMQAGNQFNIVAGDGLLEGTTRFFDNADDKLLKDAITRVACATAEAYNASAEVTFDERCVPAVNNDPEVSGLIRRAVTENLPEISLIPVPPMMISEDFACYQAVVPGAFAFVGCGNEALDRAYPNHHCKFNIDEEVISHSIKTFLAYVSEYQKTV